MHHAYMYLHDSSEGDTDHSPVYSKVKLQAKRIYHAKTVCKPCLDVSKTRDAQKVEEFITTINLSPSLSIGKVQERLDYFKDAVNGSAMPNFGKKKNKSADCSRGI